MHQIGKIIFVFLIPTSSLVGQIKSDALQNEIPGNRIEFASLGNDITGFIFSNPQVEDDKLIIVLPGFPPKAERDYLNLAPRLAEVFGTSFYFYYSGTHSSAGSFSLPNAIQNVKDAVSYTQSNYGMKKIHLVGHSFGAYLALFAGAQSADVAGIVAIAAPNVAIFGREFSHNEEAMQSWVATFNRFVGNEKPVRRGNGQEFADLLAREHQKYDLMRVIEKLQHKQVFLITAANDQVVIPELHHQPFIEALRNQRTTTLKEIVLAANHSFQNQVNELFSVIKDYFIQLD